MTDNSHHTIIAQLIEQGRHSEALALTRPRLKAAKPSEFDFYYHILALKAQKQLDEARHFNLEMVRHYPQSRTAWHNLAATLGDLEDSEEALKAVNKAISMGLTGEATLIIKGRVLVQLGRFDEGKAIYETLLAQSPQNADALRELSQLLWMQTGDLDAALSPFVNAEKHGPNPMVAIKKARLLIYAKAYEAAYEAIKPFVLTPQPFVPAQVTFVTAALLTHRDQEALVVAQDAQRRAPYDLTAIDGLFEAMAANGAYTHLYGLALFRQKCAPQDQMSYTLLATASRLTGHDDHKTLFDYAAFVKPYQLPIPDGWISLEAYLNDLRQSLYGLHNLKAHPVDQSLRGGTQTTFNLIRSTDPVIKAYYQALKGPLDDYVKALGQGDDPLRQRNRFDHKVYSSWSVQLKKDGFHVDHTHPEGWLSCAFYVDVPKSAQNDNAKEGWIRFGQSNIRAATPLMAEHWFQPKPGWLAIFPSYMWHGTEPFTSDEIRMTIASDIVPASV